MNIASLVIGTLVSQILFIITKIVFIEYLNIDSLIIQIVFYVFLIIETTAVVRRMGTLNYVESIFLTAVWFIIGLVVDLIVTTSFTGRDVYAHLYFWATYLFIVLAVLLFHKKIHIEARKGNA